MSSSKVEIDQALLDIRKVHRLLHEYQRSVMDCVRYIGSKLEFKYQGGYIRFSRATPKDGGGSLDRSPWDWLHFMFYEFFFERQIENDTLRLSIFSFADTGYFITDDPKAEKADISSFAPPEKSETKIGFALYRLWTTEFNTLFSDEEALWRFLVNDGEMPPGFKDTDIVGKCFNFNRLSDENSTMSVIDELIQKAKANGFTLEQGEK